MRATGWQPGACAIAGIGTTDFSRDSGRSDLTLATQAVLAALDDAGLSAAEVDGIVRCDMDLVRHTDLAEALGVRRLTYWGECGPGGVAPCAMVGQAVGAILSGQAEVVVVFRALNGRSGRRYGAAPPSAGQPVVGGSVSYDEFFLPHGLLTAGQMFALMAQRHMIEYGSTPEQLGSIAITCRERAQANPAAQMHGRPLAMDDYLSARVISAPLRLYDYCLETDGAAVVVVTSTERARDCRRGAVPIHAVAQASLPGTQPGTMFPALMRDSITSLSSRAVADVLWARAGLGPADIDVAQLYDCFTITLLLQLEDYGFAKRGEGGAFAADGGIGLDGPLPCNTSGGHLSEGYIHGMNLVVEAVRQVRGTSASQVHGAEVSLVTSAPPPASSALILTADR
jgi:acetyl-CoA acetyltransferase